MTPLIVGPWLGEVGFELLYWIPYLRRVLRRVPRERVWILSRGGCRSWYQGLGANYLDLYDSYAPGDIARLNATRIADQAARGRELGIRKGQQTAKQLDVSRVERELLAFVSRQAGLSQYDLLHPSEMYRAFRPYWRKRGFEPLYLRWSVLTRAKRLTTAPAAGLPDPYVAVKFYASEANPDRPVQRERIAEIVRAMADVIDVVLLHTGTRYDEHGEFPIPEHPRVHRRSFDPQTNLGEQSAIIAGASAFVGTYGGFAYLAPFLGVPTIALYGMRNFRPDHLHLMTRVAQDPLRTPFTVTDVDGGLHLIRRQRKQWMAHAA